MNKNQNLESFIIAHVDNFLSTGTKKKYFLMEIFTAKLKC